MEQAFHGGRITEAAREFELPEDYFVDFSANMNVLAPPVSDELWAEWRRSILRYPEADCAEIRKRLGSVYAIDPLQLLPTAGAIEGLYLAARLFSSLKIAIIEPAFSDYARAFVAAGNTPARVHLPQELWYAPARKWAKLVEPYDVIVLGNPNNPTAALQSPAELQQLITESGKTWIIDEAFIEFVPDRESLLPRLDPSVILLRSLTKSWAIPGLRLGFIATSNRHWMQRIQAMQPPWSIGSVTESWVRTLLTPEKYLQLQMTLRALQEIQRQFVQQLADLPGLRVYPSAANFLLAEITDAQIDNQDIYRELGRRGILVRVCDSFQGIPPGRFIRIAVRTPAENARLIEELSCVLANSLPEAA